MTNKKDFEQDFNNVPLKTFSIKKSGNHKIQGLHQFIAPKYFFRYLSRISDSENEHLYYRGTPGNHYNLNINSIIEGDARQVKRYFVVGEKGSSFRIEYPRASGDVIQEVLNNEIEEKIEYIKSIREEFKTELLPEDINTKIETLDAVIHVLGKEIVGKRKEESYYISTTVGNDNFKVAKGFSGDKGIIILGYGRRNKDIFDSQRLEELDVIYKSILKNEQEILVKDVLFPNKIIGFFVCNGEETFFVVNPWLVEKLRKVRDFENGKIKSKCEELVKIILYSSNIPVNQESFDVDNLSLGNKGKVYEDNRRIIKNF